MALLGIFVNITRIFFWKKELILNKNWEYFEDAVFQVKIPEILASKFPHARMQLFSCLVVISLPLSLQDLTATNNINKPESKNLVGILKKHKNQKKYVIGDLGTSNHLLQLVILYFYFTLKQ